MITYNLGDVILVEFPYSNLMASSKRPVIALYDAGDQDVLVARVTTQQYLTESDYKIAEWKISGLLAESWIRLGKQATIKKQYVIKQLGKLNASEIENLKLILRKILKI